MAFSISKTHKVVAIIGIAVSTLALVLGKMSGYMEKKVGDAVAPVKSELAQHIESPGHEQTERRLEKMAEDLNYIRGRLDEQWGKRSDRH